MLRRKLGTRWSSVLMAIALQDGSVEHQDSMHPLTERRMFVLLASDVQHIRMVKIVRVTVGQPDHCQDQFPTRNGYSRHGDVSAGISFGCHFSRTHKAQQF